MSAAATTGLIITDADGAIISFNKAAQDLLGVSIDEYKDTDVSLLYADPNDRRKLLDLLSRSRTVRNFEVKVKHKSGALRTVLTNIDMIEWNNEHMLLTSFYDITQFMQRHQDPPI